MSRSYHRIGADLKPNCKVCLNIISHGEKYCAGCMPRHTETGIEIGDANALHGYDVGVSKDDKISTIYVNANTRTQAAKLAQAYGYFVRDVNMIG